MPLAIATIGGLLLVLISIWRYGSVGATILAARGFALEVTPSQIAAASVPSTTPVEYNVTARNLKSYPVTIVGSEGACNCFTARALPVTIAPYRSADVKLILDATGYEVGNPLSAHVRLYVDTPSPQIYISLRAEKVVSSKASN